LSGKDYLESFLVGALSVGALHAKSTAIGLSTDVVSSLYKMKNSKGQQLPSETVKAYLSNNVSEADIQKMDTWAKDVKAEDIDKMNDDINRIANVKIGGIAYGKIGKITAKMDSGKVIEFYHKIMNSPEYKAETELLKAYKAKDNDGDDNNIEYISSNPNNPNNNPNDYAGSMQAAANPGDNGNKKAGYIRSNPDNPNSKPNGAGSLQTSANPDDNNGGKLGNAGTMLANKTPDPKKPDDDIPMEKAANGYDDIYQYTDANSNNQNNKPLSMESRNEGQGGGNDVDVYNKNTDNSNTVSQSDGMRNASNSQFENHADIDNNDIANGDDIGYKGGEGNSIKSTPKLEQHIIYGDKKASGRNGISGAHNSVEFFKNDIKIVKSIPSKDIEGITLHIYNMPKLGKDRNPIGGYRSIEFKKTVYDPNIISNEEFRKRGLEAANNSFNTNKILESDWEGYDSYGVKWLGFARNGEIITFFPDIPEE
ncbi:MAG: EndoU domain-containing protein, partial [Eubacteriaceae bacterium]|nr:EndoU domain-containing protein [Eubacteriaceae bacterium]